MPFLAPIGIALGVAATATTAAAVVGGLAIASAGIGIAGGIKSLIGGSGGQNSGGSGIGAPAVTPTIPSVKNAAAAAQTQIKEKKRRATTRIATSQGEQTNLLANPATTKKTLLGA